MIVIPRPGGRREVRRNTAPVPGAAGRYLRLRAARALVGLAVSLMRMAALAYRAGYLDPAGIEYCVGVSAKLRGRACHLIGTTAPKAPSAPPAAELKSPAVTSLSHSSHARAAGLARSAPE
jgi:hypothetical protein